MAGNRIYLIAAIVIGIISCDAPGDVEPVDRNTFIKFFGNSSENIGVGLIQEPEGYVLLNSSIEGDSSQKMTLIKTDLSGNEVWAQDFLGAEAFDIIKINGGYLILGDSLKPIDETESISSIYLIQTDLNGIIVNSLTISDQSGNESDYHGVTLTISPSGDVIVVGTRENENDLDETILYGISPDLNIVWQQIFAQDNRSYEIGKSVYSDNNSLIWTATSLAFTSDDNDLADAYITLPVTGINAENINNSSYGNAEPGSYFAQDIWKDASGITLVGFTNSNGNNDIFFIRASVSGFFKENTATIISTTLTGVPLSGNDQGLAITRASDGGFVIAGSINTTPQIGNGERDIYLLKLDASGNPVWENIIGGSGSEIASNILETDDGGFLIYGTQIFQNASMSMLIKTNNRGRLVD